MFEFKAEQNQLLKATVTVLEIQLEEIQVYAVAQATATMPRLKHQR
jgi:hypothetical protein